KIPHGVDVPAIDRQAARRRQAEATGFSLQDSTPVFGIFGFLKPYKRIYEALRALARLKADYPSVKMILAGEEHPHYPLRPLLSELGLEDSVKILGYLPLEQFTQLLAATDYCLNLRHPTAGETSGTLLRALGMGKPTLVSAIGSFADLPDDVVFKIPVDEREELWVYEYMRAWLDDPELARSVGERGRQYVQRTALWPDVAGQYLRFLEECVERPAPRPASQGVALPAAAGNGTSALALSDDALAEYIMGFSHASRLMEEYVLSHLRRLVRTLRLTPPGGPNDRILELGCYLQITPALQSLLGYGEVRGAYYGTAGQQVTRSAVSITGETFSCRIDLFDAERDPFPYPPGYFQTVLCCELLEHLATDPMHMMAEINRVLAVGGHLLLTTPNIASFRSVRAVLHGDHPGMFPAYIKPAADGSVDPRHSREYTPGEIARLADAAGFFVERLETGGYAPQEPDSAWARRFLESNGLSTELRGELIYCLARKVAPLRDRWPKDFYYP
ncbi:MAG TPA: glycosyltransferase, partial [Terriglobia bacterium]|nr:glycosyltransferase [Terriglobia bacterium]